MLRKAQLSIITGMQYLSSVVTHPDEESIGEVHSAADETWHWLSLGTAHRAGLSEFW